MITFLIKPAYSQYSLTTCRKRHAAVILNELVFIHEHKLTSIWWQPVSENLASDSRTQVKMILQPLTVTETLVSD